MSPASRHTSRRSRTVARAKSLSDILYSPATGEFYNSLN